MEPVITGQGGTEELLLNYACRKDLCTKGRTSLSLFLCLYDSCLLSMCMFVFVCTAPASSAHRPLSASLSLSVSLTLLSLSLLSVFSR